MDDLDVGALDNLVTQFSSALDCLRELVQNSIDAASPRIDVWLEYIPGSTDTGTIALHVEDCGEGMDEQIIDNQLTRLFASSKENDLTKIGKFGIGFVSVFALSPAAVLLHTGRGGEFWEVMFHADRSFSKTRLDVPVEGTQVTLFIEAGYGRYRQIVDDARATLSKWCNHSDTEIVFEDRSPPSGAASTRLDTINEPFDVEGTCVTRVRHQGTEIVAAYSDEPIYGFYNRGLTLALTSAGDQVLDRRAERYEHISLKIKSRFLEHTLSRETVLRDENYEKAMRLVDGADDDDVLSALIDRMEALVAQPHWDASRLQAYADLIRYFTREPDKTFQSHETAKILRCVDGTALSPSMLLDTYREHGRVFVADCASELSAELARAEVPVLLGRGGDGFAGDPLGVVRNRIVTIVDRLHSGSLRGVIQTQVFGADIFAEADARVVSPEDVYHPVRIDPSPPEDVAALVAAAEALLRGEGVGYDQLTTCTLATPVADPPFFVIAEKLSGAMATPPPPLCGRKRAAARFCAAVNRDHPQFETMRRLSRRSRALAAYCLAKGVLLTEDRELWSDTAIMARALGVRTHG